jgi:hypothetical protein
LDASRKLDAEADVYAMETLIAVSRTWDAEELNTRLASDAPSDLAARVVKEGKPLGKLQTSSPFVVIANSFFIKNSVKTSRVKTGTDAVYEHGSAHIEATLVNNGSGWHVMDFQITRTADAADVRKI